MKELGQEIHAYRYLENQQVKTLTATFVDVICICHYGLQLVEQPISLGIHITHLDIDGFRHCLLQLGGGGDPLHQLCCCLALPEQTLGLQGDQLLLYSNHCPLQLIIADVVKSDQVPTTNKQLLTGELEDILYLFTNRKKRVRKQKSFYELKTLVTGFAKDNSSKVQGLRPELDYHLLYEH